MDISHVTNPSSSMSTRPNCQVFLSFRGPDTRRNFADFLYSSLSDVGIRVFRDEEELESGEEIQPQLIQAIEQSKISIPIISQDYGSSKSCLMELEQMLKCKGNKSHIIIPIFYYVDPSDVRRCRGPFKEALNVHKKRGRDGSFLNPCKFALQQIGDLAGYHLQEKNEKNHGEVIKRIVHEVEQKLKTRDLIVPKQLVGVDPHVQEIMAKLKVDYRNGQAVKIGDTCGKVLIHGIPGVGKTVLAKCLYNQLNHLFDACSFLEKFQEEIKDHRIVSVQNRLICHLHKGNAQKFDCSDHALTQIQRRFLNMKVLLLLDDVKDRDQLSELVGELGWLGRGSMVIVTSRRCDVLQKVNGAENYVLGSMKEDKALTLFCKHAFNTDSPPEDLKKLATDIVAATDGLPLALENVGKFLFEKDKIVWKEKLIQLKKAPDMSVREALFKSYTTLDDEAQQIFLDIACFFNGMDKRIPHYMWDNCEYFPCMSILSLHAMSLVEFGENKELRMRAILKNFGREIVKSENKDEPCQRSRLWNHEEALDVLSRRKVTSASLGLEFADESVVSIRCDRFDKLQKLRLLKLDRADIQGNFEDYFLRLKWFEWQGCPGAFHNKPLIPNVQNLVVLDLSGSQVDKNWSGWLLLDQAKKLKVLKLTGCVQLIATPTFPVSITLERLILEDCSKLVKISPSFLYLSKLVYLNMKGCSLINDLQWPYMVPMGSLKELLIDRTSISQIHFQSMIELKTLSVRDCIHLTTISDSIRHLKSLKYLALDGSGICTLQESIQSLENLQILSLKNCTSLSNLPYGIGNLSSLQSLDLSGTVIEELPPSVKDLKAMKVLRMRGTFIQEFPKAILNLEKLEEIDFSLCRGLEGRIDCDIGTLSSLAILKLSNTQISGLPPSISSLSRLQELHISGCHNLQSLPKLPCCVNVF
ncbi:hypothetical protein BT93_E2958 [Corymbia citriodora subsp. variegata]|nr:hypothetical protein BT93_E2958 [Corymbia citriodora subsp. variegata]